MVNNPHGNPKTFLADITRRIAPTGKLTTGLKAPSNIRFGPLSTFITPIVNLPHTEAITSMGGYIAGRAGAIVHSAVSKLPHNNRIS